MASSEALAKAAYGNAAQTNDAQKAALLDAVAQAGAAGKQQYEQAGQAINQDRSAALNYAASQGAGGQNLLGGQKDLGFLAGPNSALDTLAASNASGQAALAGDTARQSANASDYFSKINAAIPVEQARTQGVIEQALQQARDAEATRKYNRDMQQMQLEEARMAFQRSQADAAKPTAEDIAKKQTQFIVDLSKNFGPKQAGLAEQLIHNNKDLAGAMTALRNISAATAGFKNPFKDADGNVLGVGGWKNVDEDVITRILQDYYGGNGAPTRDTFAPAPAQQATSWGAGRNIRVSPGRR